MFVAIPPEIRFAEKFYIDKDTGCWMWIAGKNRRGYGKFRIGKKTMAAPRASLLIYRGISLPSHLCACHTCDTPECVNPDHLFVGTNKENSEDMKRKGRQTYGERNGRSKLKEEDVRKIRDLPGRHEEIAAAFNVSRSLVRMIKANQLWRCIK